MTSLEPDRLGMAVREDDQQEKIARILVKSPKIYVRDSGLVHALLGLTDFNVLAGSPLISPKTGILVSL